MFGRKNVQDRPRDTFSAGGEDLESVRCSALLGPVEPGDGAPPHLRRASHFPDCHGQHRRAVQDRHLSTRSPFVDRLHRVLPRQPLCRVGRIVAYEPALLPPAPRPFASAGRPTPDRSEGRWPAGPCARSPRQTRMASPPSDRYPSTRSSPPDTGRYRQRGPCPSSCFSNSSAIRRGSCRATLPGQTLGPGFGRRRDLPENLLMKLD